MKSASAKNGNNTQSTNSKNKTNMKQTALVPVNPAMPAVEKDCQKEFSYEPSIVSPASLRIHPLLEIVGFQAPDDIFIERANHFKFYERSVITEDGYVVTHPTDVLAAQKSGVKEMEVVVMKGALLNDIIDFISFKHVWQHGKSRRKLYEMSKFLTAFVLQQDKTWKKQFTATKTRGIVAEIMGVSDGSIQNIMKIGRGGEELLGKIDNGELVGSKAIELVRSAAPKPAERAIDSRKRYSNLIISNSPDISNGEKAKLKIRSVKLDVEEIGLIEFEITEAVTSMFINGEHFKNVTHNVVSDKEYDGKRDYSQHHTLLPNDDSFDVQFILKGLENLIDNQNKLAA